MLFRSALATTAPGPPPSRPGWSRWTLQTILQVLGALLLAGAGLVFTAFAWGAMSLGVRGVILVGITAAVFVGARRAAHANLRSAAEVVAALGSVLVVLDAWVLLSTTVAGDNRAATAMAGALLVGAAVLVPLGRALALSTASVVGLVCLTLAPAVLATVTSSAPGAALLLAASAALCSLDLHPLLTQKAHTPDAVHLRHARTALTVLAPCYLGLAGMSTLAALLQLGPAQSVGPLIAIAVASGLWAVRTAVGLGRSWSATAGTSLVLAGTAGAGSLTGAESPLSLMWLLPVGALVGLTVTVGALRALPRAGAAAARAGWVVVLVIALLPAVATAALLLTVMMLPSTLGSSRTALDLLPICAGLGVMVVGLPVLHRLGGDMITARPHQESMAGGGAGTISTAAPGQSRVLIDHPLGGSVVAATVLLLSLPLLAPDATWAVVTQLAAATLVALASTRLPDRISATVTTSASAPAPAPTLAERFVSLARGCVQSCCAVAATWAVITAIATASGATTTASGRADLALIATSFAVVGLVLCVARGWGRTADEDGNRAALAFASLIIASVGAGILARATIPLTSLGWYAAPLPLVLVLVALGTRDLRVVRASRVAPPGDASPDDSAPHDESTGPRPLFSADRLASLGAAAVLVSPACTVIAASALVTTAPDSSLAVSLLATALLGAVAILLWQLSFSAAAPVQQWLRVTAGALVPVIGVLVLLSLRLVALAENLVVARIDWPLTVLGILVVLVIWTGTTISGVVRRACELSILTLAGVTTVAVASQGDTVRVTLALSISAVGAFAYAIASQQPRWGWLGLGLSVCASWVCMSGIGARLPLETYTAPGAAVLVAVASWQLVTSLRSGAPSGRTEHAVHLLLAGLAVLALPSVLLTPDAGAHGRAIVTLVGVLWLGGAARLITLTTERIASRTRSLSVGMTVLALVGATLGLGGHGIALARQVVSGTGGPGQVTGPVLATWLWTAAAVLVTAALAVQLVQLRFPRSSPADLRLGQLVADPRVWAITVCAVLLTTPVTVLLVGGWFAATTSEMAAALVIGWGLTALLGTPPGAPRVQASAEFALRAVPALAGAYAAAFCGAYATAMPTTGTGGETLVQLLTIAGVFVAVVGVRAAHVAPASSTWRTVAPGAFATIVPLTLQMIAEPSGPWVVAAMITAAAWLVLGVRLRWQAPVACGGLALVAQVAVLAGPPALAAMSGMLGWMVLAAVGSALLALGLTYERQIATARTVLRRYSELR